MVHWMAAIAGVVASASLVGNTMAHTWIDCIDTDRSVVYDNARNWIYGGTSGNGLCRGYMKNYPGRGDPDVNTKMTFKILMDDVPKGVPVCSPEPADYSDWRHRIQVKPGEQFYYGYTDNGHTSKDKAGRGTFYGVYWTGQPDTNLGTTLDLTQEKLIDGQLHDFDDGNCGQTYEDGDFSGTILSGRAGNDYPCVGNLVIPADTRPGIYNLVWFWKFYNDQNQAPVGAYGGAAYSSCFQVEVLPSDTNGAAPVTDTPTMQPVTPAPPPAALGFASLNGMR